jgi:hypothetical protein
MGCGLQTFRIASVETETAEEAKAATHAEIEEKATSPKRSSILSPSRKEERRKELAARRKTGEELNS